MHNIYCRLFPLFITFVIIHLGFYTLKMTYNKFNRKTFLGAIGWLLILLSGVYHLCHIFIFWDEKLPNYFLSILGREDQHNGK